MEKDETTMARYVIDIACALRITELGVQTITDHELLAPTLLRSQVLDELFRRSVGGDLDEAIALDLNTRFAKVKIRYLGDAVLRRRAWTIAKEFGMASTFDAEYIALTELQGDALITEDRQLAKVATRRVSVKTFDALGVIKKQG